MTMTSGVKAGTGLAVAASLLLWSSVTDLGARQAIERRVYVSVADDKGAPVPNLSAADFVVREDGMAREVLRVSRATDPMQIAVLADDTQAATPMITEERRALRAFVAAMHQGNEIALLTFGERPGILTDYTVTLDALTNGVDRLFARPGAGSYLLEALMQTTTGIRKRESPRPVIVVVTTEGEEFSNDYHVTVTEAVQRSRAQLHAIIRQMGDADPSTDANRNRSIVLADATMTTGGRRDFLLVDTALTPKLEELATELTQQYALVYARTQTLIPPTRLEVSVKRPGLTVRAPSRADIP
jgi:Ca-activated chloride channel homolog